MLMRKTFFFFKRTARGRRPRAVLALHFVYLFIYFCFVGYQMQTFARPSADQGFESRNLYCSLYVTNKSHRAIEINKIIY